MLRIFCILLFALALNAAQNQRTLGLESFLGGNAGEKGEIELAKIRIENLKAMKKELEEEARRLAIQKHLDAPVYVEADDPQVGELLAQIASLKKTISELSKEGQKPQIKKPENSAKKDEFISKQGLYISADGAKSFEFSKNSSTLENSKENSKISENSDPAGREQNSKISENSVLKEQFKKACDAKNFEKCNDFGVFAFGKSELNLAKNAFDIACMGGINGACANLGMTEQRLGNIQKANEILNNACDKGSGDACNNLALMNNEKELFYKACELKSALGCANLAILLDSTNDKNAEQIRKKACFLGDKDSCE